jgi:hypothetical protein
MATDAVVLEQSGELALPTELTTVLQLGPLQTGRSYVIWAKGSISTSATEAHLELEAFNVIDDVGITFLANIGHASFSLAVAITLPPDDELFVVARLSGRASAVTDPHHSSIAIVKNVKIVALTVDTLQVQTA